MHKTIVALTFVSLVSLFAGSADAKAKRPTICFSFTEATMPVDGEAQKVAICTDGKKPVVLTSYQVTTLKNDEGVPTKAAIGYR
jgi:hypothetical protein